MALSPELQEMFDLRFFHDHGWIRKECPTCKEPFWTLDERRTLCGDSTCEEYQFLGDPLTDDPMSLAEMREAFLSYWEGKSEEAGGGPAPDDRDPGSDDSGADGSPEHTRVPRNPVVARWRDDIYLNIASIANYQPHVTSGEVPPPANPLVVSQPCIRLNDLANIGRSGRHFACFEMMGHHAFNSEAWGEHYWTEACVAHGQRFLTDTLGLDGRRITYKEAVWSGGGNAGPCFEVFAGGLEVATLVFMCLEEDEEGELEIKGERYAMMDLKIIDTGWGLERLAWASTGTPTAYDTVFPDAIKKVRSLASVPIADDARSRQLVEMHARVQGVLNLDIGTRLDKLREEVVGRMAEHGIETTVAELEEVMDPIEAMYALCDHLRCLSFMVGDGIVPGNVKAGYLERLIFRRAFRFMERLGIDEPLSDLLAWNMERMLDEFPEFEPAIERAREIAELEHERFVESRERGLRLVERILGKRKELGVDDLVDLYDTHGLGPNTVAQAARTMGVDVDVPDTFDAIVAERHGKEKRAKASGVVPTDVPQTRRIFYEDAGQWEREFEATVTWVGVADVKALGLLDEDGKVSIDVGVFRGEAEPDQVKLVTLDQTCFFHETGGQPCDQGVLHAKKLAGVCKVIKEGEQPVHVVVDPEGIIVPGTKVQGIVDWELRMDHTRSHTATHIMNQSVRRVLGQHSWQAGTQKYPDCARVDMTHFRRPTREEVHAIERLANAVVMQGRPVIREWHKRNEAESKWGTQLLQGGIPKGNDVRVVRIGPAPEGGELDAPTGPVRAGEDFDVEYCGGTHCMTTQSVGPIKVYRTERIQDGIERFEYSAGLHGVARWQGDADLLRDAASELQVAPPELPQAAKRFFDEWKERGKLLDEVRRQLAELKAQAAAGGAQEVGGVRIIMESGLEPGALQKTAAELIGNGSTVALLAAPAGDQVRLLFARSPDVDIDMGALLRDVAVHVDGKGGGRPDFAQGGGTKADGLEACLAAAKEKVQAALE